jgi:hypothetical protein
MPIRPRDPARPRGRRQQVLAALTVASLAVLAACGDDDDSSGDAATAATAPTATASTTAPAAGVPATPATTAPPAATTASTTAVAAPEATEVAVGFADHSFTMPATIPAGLVRFTATNNGAEDHQLVMARVRDGLTPAQVLATFATDQAAAVQQVDFYAGPNEVGPGATATSEVVLPPGQYLALCVIPSPDGVPHAAKGMVSVVEVTGDAAAATDPALGDHEATLSLVDYDFTLSPGFDGTGRVLVTNQGAQAHELSIFRIGAGGSFAEYQQVLADPASGTPDVLGRYPAAGGITPVAPGGTAVAELALPPGDYVFVCFVPDAGDGLPHFVHQMIKQVTIPA